MNPLKTGDDQQRVGTGSQRPNAPGVTKRARITDPTALSFGAEAIHGDGGRVRQHRYAAALTWNIKTSAYKAGLAFRRPWDARIGVMRQMLNRQRAQLARLRLVDTDFDPLIISFNRAGRAAKPRDPQGCHSPAPPFGGGQQAWDGSEIRECRFAGSVNL